MNECLAESDLRELSQTMLADFERRVASIPQDLCAPFHSEAMKLEVELLSIYKMVTLCVRKEQDLDRVASYWDLMVNICDQTSRHLLKLVQQHPHCGADWYHDRVLDLRNKCHRLQQMHS